MGERRPHVLLRRVDGAFPDPTVECMPADRAAEELVAATRGESVPWGHPVAAVPLAAVERTLRLDARRATWVKPKGRGWHLALSLCPTCRAALVG